MLAPVLRSALLEQPLSKSLLRSAYNASVAHAVEFSTLPSSMKGEEGSSSTSVTSLTQSQLSSAMHLGRRSQKTTTHVLKIAGGDRGFASGSEVSTTSAQGQNSWSKFRAPFGTERKSTLSPAMYTMIGVFGFSAYLNDHDLPSATGRGHAGPDDAAHVCQEILNNPNFINLAMPARP